MGEHMDETELDALLKAADPYPPSRPVDPAIATRALARIEEELTMTDVEPTPTPRRSRRRRGLTAALAVAVVVAAGALAAVKFGGDDEAATSAGRPVGDALASCIAFSTDILAMAPIAFDGTVTKVDGDDVTFDVERWYRGGESDEVTVLARSLVEGAPQLNGGVGFVEGGRYLVSADDTTGAIVPAICGFTVEYTDEMATQWETAFGS